MPKKIIIWECEICGDHFDDKAGAKRCEKKGYSRQYPIGTIFGNNSVGSFYGKIIFAIAENREYRGHLNDSGKWACRDMSVGDTLGKKMCGGGFVELKEFDAKIDRTMPAFKRMVNWLQENSIQPYIWNGKEAVKYEDKETQEVNDAKTKQ